MLFSIPQRFSVPIQFLFREWVKLHTILRTEVIGWDMQWPFSASVTLYVLDYPVLLPGKSHGWRSLVGCSSWGRKESDTTERFHFHALEKEMATHSSVLAWSILRTGEPGGLPSMGSHRVGHDWRDLAAAAATSSDNHLPFCISSSWEWITASCTVSRTSVHCSSGT